MSEVEASKTPCLSPKRVQFTMRTYFVAALWISFGFAVHRATTRIPALSMGLDNVVSLAWVAFWVWITVWWIAGRLRAHTTRIAMVLGILVMAGGGSAMTVSDRLSVFPRFVPPEHLTLAMSRDFVEGAVVFSLFWSAFLGVFLGISRGIAHLAISLWKTSSGRSSDNVDEAKSERWQIARLTAAAYLIVLAIAFGINSTAQAMSPPTNGWQDVTSHLFPTMVILLNAPIHFPLVSFFSSESLAIAIFHWGLPIRMIPVGLFDTSVGLPLYYALGWAIGWWMERRERLTDRAGCDRQLQCDFASPTASGPRERAEDPAAVP